MKYDFQIHHIPGKNLNKADTLSRAPTCSATPEDKNLQNEAAALVATVTDAFPATDQRFTEIRAAQTQDDVCRSITSFCTKGWPEQHQFPASLKLYWPIVQSSISTITIFLSVDRELSYQQHCKLRSYSSCILVIRGSANVSKEPNFLYGGRVSVCN